MTSVRMDMWLWAARFFKTRAWRRRLVSWDGFSRGYSLDLAANVSITAMFGNSSWGTLCRSCRYAGLL